MGSRATIGDGLATRLGHAAAPWGLWLLGLAAAFYPAFRSGFRDLQIQPGDPRIVQYLLEHSFRWIRGDSLHAQLWSPPVFHPATGVGAYTDTVLGAAPIYWFGRAGGLDPDLSYQLWMMACLSLDFAAAYWLLSRSLRASPAAAAFGAFLFAFASQRLANFNSPQLFVLFYGVLALDALLRGLEPDRSRRSAARWLHAAAAWMTLQTLASWYPTFFWIFILSMAGAAALLFADTRAHLLAGLSRNRAALVSASLLFALAVAPMAHAHLDALSETGWRSWNSVKSMLPTWQSWVYAGHSNRVYGGFAARELFAFSGPEPSHANGVGFVTLGVAIAGLWHARRSAAARLVIVTTALVMLASTRVVGDHSLWAAVYAGFPGAASIRFVARIGMFLSFAAAIGATLFFDAWRPRPAVRIAVGLLLGALCLREQLHDLGVTRTRAYRGSVLEIAGTIDRRCPAFFLETEHAEPLTDRVLEIGKISQAAAMWISLEAGVPTVNGNLGNHPRGWHMPQVAVHDAATRDDLDARLRAWLVARGVDPATVCRLRIPAARMPGSRA